MGLDDIKNIMKSLEVGSKIIYIESDRNSHKVLKALEEKNYLSGVVTEIDDSCEFLGQDDHDVICRRICRGFIGINNNEPDCMIIDVSDNPEDDQCLILMIANDIFKKGEFDI